MMREALRQRSLVIRADASDAIGSGHVFRCLAIAEAWIEDGGDVSFLMAGGGERLTRRLSLAGVHVVPLDGAPGSEADARATRGHAERVAALGVIVDGYHFDASYRQFLLGGPYRLLIVDDSAGQGPYRADLLVNASPEIGRAHYSQEAPLPELLLGPRYALLRREFAAYGGRRAAEPEHARRVLITMGGADPGNFSLAVLRALEASRADTYEVTIVAGPNNPHIAVLEQGAAASRHSVKLAEDVQDMVALLGAADLAITAGGGTCFELARLGVPSLVVAISDSQIAFARAFARAVGAAELGRSSAAVEAILAASIDDLAGDRLRRTAMSRRLQTLVDGRGAKRVASALCAKTNRK